MFVSNSVPMSLIFSIVTMLCWGTNKIAVKYSKYSVAFFTIDFFVFMFFFHLFLGLTIGSEAIGNENDMIQNLVDVISLTKGKAIQIWGPFAGGVSTALFTLILNVLVDGWGLSASVPIVFGAAMLFGSLITYLIEREANLPKLLIGLMLLLIAIIINTIASVENGKIQQARKFSNEMKSVTVQPNATSETATKVLAPASSSPTESKKFEIVKKSGSSTYFWLLFWGIVTDTIYAPCTSLAKSKLPAISPYGNFLLVSIGALLIVFPATYFICMRNPIKGNRLYMKDYFTFGFADRWPAFWSAFLLAIGNVTYASAGDKLSFAISYALSRGTLLVSALWGVVYFKEFANTGRRVWYMFGTAVVLFVVAIVICAMAIEKKKV